MSNKNRNLLFLSICIILPILYGFFFVRNFTFPLSGGGDVDEWEYVGYYLAENIHFNPFPNISLNHNNTFYPYGTTQVFSDWSLESNYWFAFFYKNFGHGAWLNYYYIISLIISFLGSYLLLKNEFGQNKAFFVGFIVTFFNFYALNKYPHHYNHSTIHWTILSLFSDFILTKKIILRENISLKWILLKAFLLIATLGMNLGYICGFALSSFVLNFVVLLVILLRRHFNKEFQLIYHFNSWFLELKLKPIYFIFLSIPSLILLYFYLPLVLQIYFEAKYHPLNDINAANYWSSPLRMLLPYFPSISALQNPYVGILKDMPEGFGSGSAGWFCLTLGVIGFLKNRQKYWLVFLPFLILLIISTFYHPVRIPTLKIFPWGAYNRVPSRFTSMLPVIFCCFFLPINWSKFQLKKVFIFVMTLIFFLETFEVFSFRFKQKPYEFDKNFFSYLSNIEKQKGEAVMDFPFCIVGGDGSGLKENLCPIFQKTCNVYALSRFHHKKVIGGYYSHVQESAMNGFVNTGIGKWTTADSPDWQNASKITNKFSDEQLEHFLRYFQYNDFVGINVCTDLIPKEMYEQIIEKIGKPTNATEFPGAGKVVFIAKPQEWKKYINKKNALKMHFPCGCN